MTRSTPIPPAARFPRTARLRKRVDFDRVYQQGRRHFGGHLTVFFLRREDGPQGTAEYTGPRVGFTVGRALGGAVVRNRIRRRMREAVRRHLAQLQAPVDLVVHPRKSVLKAQFAELDDEVGRALQAVAAGRGEGRRKE